MSSPGVKGFWNWLKAWLGVDRLGLLFAIAALVVGIDHLKEINHTVDKVDRVREQLSSQINQMSAQINQTDATLTHVRETLSTRYLSRFPEFMPYIVNLVGNANESVVIFCDIPGYAVLSDSASAGQYCDLLEQKRRNKSFRIELTCMDATSRTKYFEEQFKTFDLAAWRRDPTLRQRLDTFAASQGLDVQSLQTPAKLIAAIQDANEETFRHTFLSRAVQTADPMSIYFWIADGKTAIFSIPALSADAIEYGFITSDRDLILAFQNMKRRYDEAAARRGK